MTTLIGPPLHQISIEDLQGFLDGAEAEPLLWEAKGTTLHRDSVRKAICGFANGRETAYLILGAEEKDGGGWALGGVDLGGDPPAWISGVVADGLRPAPLVDVRSLSTGDGNHVAIVEVPPIAIPPCISRGTVYERVSGRTIPITDPARLAELYESGRNAREAARSAALDAAIAVIEDPDGPGAGSGWPRVSLAVAASGHPSDISSRLFSECFEGTMIEIVKRDLVPPTHGVPDAFGPKLSTGFEQSNRWVDCEDRLGHGKPCYWHVRVIWDGTVVVCGAWDVESIDACQLASELINAAWTTAGHILGELGGYGPTHMELQVQGEDSLIGGPRGNPMPRIRLGRGPLEAPPGEEMFASVERELRRASGEAVYE